MNEKDLDEVYAEAVRNVGQNRISVPFNWGHEKSEATIIIAHWLTKKMNYNKAAISLSMSRATLYRKIDTFKLTREIGAKLLGCRIVL